ncbi:MAG: T9SS type A sorting domain-containing protein [Bacteroidota bacterium]|nr:T9SS type A sorting domain-containing protein [Bacteroidota bacterium]
MNIFERMLEECDRLCIQEKRYGKSSSLLDFWKEEGPLNIAGRIRGIAIHPSNPDIVYLCTASGGVWKSLNFGQSWFCISNEFPMLPVGAIAIDPGNPNRVYAGTGEPAGAGYQNGGYTNGRINGSPIWSAGAGVMRSDDGGMNWSQKTWSNPYAVHRLAVHPEGGDTVLAATITGLYKTTNGGNSWSRTSVGVITDVQYKPGQPSRVYIAMGDDDGDAANGIYVSDAGGRSFSWRKTGVNFPAGDSCGRICLAVSPADPDRLYAAVARSFRTITSSENDFLMLLVSRDGGETWERKINAISTSFTNGQAYYDLALAVSPTDPDFVLLGGLDVHRSTNGGTSFVRVSRDDVPMTDARYVHVDIHAFAFKPGEPNTIMVGNDGGISISTDRGSSWQRRVLNLGTVQYYTCNYDPSNPTTYVGGSQDNGTHGKFTTDNAAWYELYGGDGGSIVIDPARPTVRYLNSLLSNPSGPGYVRPVIRTGIGNALPMYSGLNSGENPDRWNWIPPLLFHPTDRTRLYTATQYVYVVRNPDVGNNPTWRLISPELGSIVTKLAVVPSDGERMYAVTANGWAWVTTNLSATSPTWTKISNGLPARWLTDIAIDPSNPQSVYVTASGYGAGHVFKTTDAGQSWVNITGDLPDIPANAIVRSRDDANTLFVATDLGVFVTTNGGTNWRRYGTGLPNVIVYDMKLTPDNRLLAATFGRGMWTTSAVVSVGNTPAAASTFTLHQNFPTLPSNNETFIPFSLVRKAEVSLQLYDVSGRLQCVVFEGTLSPGEHRMPVRLEKLPAGTYFYALSSNGERQTRKLIVIR